MGDLTLRQLQEEQRPWVEHNFPGRKPYFPLLGVVEEIGELAHAHLKAEQGIRGTKEELALKARDAIGDVIVFLADYCTASGYDLQSIVEEVWAEVKQRDWKANPEDADEKARGWFGHTRKCASHQPEVDGGYRDCNCK